MVYNLQENQVFILITGAVGSKCAWRLKSRSVVGFKSVSLKRRYVRQRRTMPHTPPSHFKTHTYHTHLSLQKNFISVPCICATSPNCRQRLASPICGPSECSFQPPTPPLLSLSLSPCHHIKTNPSERLSSRATTARRHSGCWRS